MGVSLSKGGNVSLSKEAPGLTSAMIGLGWDTRTTDGADFDLDAVIFITGENGKVRSDSDFIFYNNMKGPGIEHMGDNTDGEGDGDDEQVKIDLPTIPADVKKLVIGVTIHDADKRGQNFGQVSNAFVRVVNNSGDVEIVRFDLSEDYSTETAMVFGELYRHGDEWKFKAVGQGFAGGLGALASNHGVNI